MYTRINLLLHRPSAPTMSSTCYLPVGVVDLDLIPKKQTASSPCLQDTIFVSVRILRFQQSSDPSDRRLTARTFVDDDVVGRSVVFLLFID